jgi:hypothetical protein
MRDAMDAVGARDECTNQRTAKSCGLDASTLAFNLVTMLAHRTGDGDKKPITRESTKEAVKTIRAGKAGLHPADLW